MTAAPTKEWISERIAEYNKMTPRQRAQWRIDQYNQSEGFLDKEEYDCPQCRNRGNFKGLRQDLSEYVEDCGCMLIRKSIWSAKAAGIYEGLRRCDFKGFRCQNKWQENMKNTAKNWARNADTEWLLLCGQSGSGKTHLTLAAVGYRIFHRNQRVYFLDWRKFNTLRECDKSKFQEMLEMSETAEILFIDDLLKLDKGRSFNPSIEIELSFQILNTRCNHNRVTVISTELVPESLLKMDEATGSRILDMAKQFKCTIGIDPKKNQRLH